MHLFKENHFKSPKEVVKQIHAVSSHQLRKCVVWKKIILNHANLAACCTTGGRWFPKSNFATVFQPFMKKVTALSSSLSPVTSFFPFCVIPENCHSVLCPGTTTCVVDQTNNAYCVTCNRICPDVPSSQHYLCGNDGITYASACHLRKATCLLGRSIGVAYDGRCISKCATRDARA